MRGDEAVERFGDEGDTGYELVYPERPCGARARCEEVKDGFSPAVARTALEELDGLLKLGNGDTRKPAGIGLVRDILDLVACEFLPIPDPDAAE